MTPLVITSREGFGDTGSIYAGCRMGVHYRKTCLTRDKIDIPSANVLTYLHGAEREGVIIHCFSL